MSELVSESVRKIPYLSDRAAWEFSRFASAVITRPAARQVRPTHFAQPYIRYARHLFPRFENISIPAETNRRVAGFVGRCMESYLPPTTFGTEDSMQRTLGELVHCAIENNPYLAGRKLRFEAEAGRVVLKGTVSTFFQKQMAQEALRRIDGIREIENELEVSWA